MIHMSLDHDNRITIDGVFLQRVDWAFFKHGIADKSKRIHELRLKPGGVHGYVHSDQVSFSFLYPVYFGHLYYMTPIESTILFEFLGLEVIAYRVSPTSNW
jgi:hypothetical protein